MRIACFYLWKNVQFLENKNENYILAVHLFYNNWLSPPLHSTPMYPPTITLLAKTLFTFVAKNFSTCASDDDDNDVSLIIIMWLQMKHDKQDSFTQDEMRRL